VIAGPQLSAGADPVEGALGHLGRGLAYGIILPSKAGLGLR